MPCDQIPKPLVESPAPLPNLESGFGKAAFPKSVEEVNILERSERNLFLKQQKLLMLLLGGLTQPGHEVRELLPPNLKWRKSSWTLFFEGLKCQSLQLVPHQHLIKSMECPPSQSRYPYSFGRTNHGKDQSWSLQDLHSITKYERVKTIRT